jgi:hypothetical protein
VRALKVYLQDWATHTHIPYKKNRNIFLSLTLKNTLLSTLKSRLKSSKIAI